MDLIELSALEAAVAGARSSGVDADARAVLRWARGLLGERLMMSTSFQKGGMVLLHLAREVVPEIPVYFLDTGFHFQETLDFARQIRDDWGIRLVINQPKLIGQPFEEKHGKLHDTNPDLCCHLNKVEPNNEILARYQGWVTSIRRDQSSTRAQAEVLEVLEGARLKVQPLAHWTREQVNAYIWEHKIPIHPLYSQGYTSIGCAPCTQPSSDPLNERAGRWGGKKVECGLHTFWKAKGDKPVHSPGGAPVPEVPVLPSHVLPPQPPPAADPSALPRAATA